MLRTYTIELRADFADEEKHEMIEQLTREAARNLLATATLIKEKREPQIALQCGDMFEGNKELSIHDADKESEGESEGEK